MHANRVYPLKRARHAQKPSPANKDTRIEQATLLARYAPAGQALPGQGGFPTSEKPAMVDHSLLKEDFFLY